MKTLRKHAGATHWFSGTLTQAQYDRLTELAEASHRTRPDLVRLLIDAARVEDLIAPCATRRIQAAVADAATGTEE